MFKLRSECGLRSVYINMSEPVSERECLQPCMRDNGRYFSSLLMLILTALYPSCAKQCCQFNFILSVERKREIEACGLGGEMGGRE